MNHSGNDHGLAIDDLVLTWVSNSSPTITVSTAPTSFLENAGPTASVGTVTIPAALDTALVIDLASSDTTETTVPASVTIPIGATSATFPIAAVNDLLADGAQVATISASTAGYVSGQAIVTVNDDADAPLAVTVLPSTFSEAAGPNAAVGTVELAEITPVAVTVELSSNNITEATVPPSVVIEANTKSVTFPVAAQNEAFVDGTKSVTIQATALNYTTGSTVIQVTDDGDMAPPATLSPGAIAFTGFNADVLDVLTFVVLSPIAGTDKILFADRQWNGLPVGAGGSFNSNSEGVLTWSAPPGGLAPGTVVSLYDLSASPDASLGTLVLTAGSFNLSGSAESVYAYQGDPLIATGFLAYISTGTDTTVGTGLTAQHIVKLTADIDIAEYTGSRSNQSGFSGYLSLIVNTAANWITQDGTGDQSQDAILPDIPFNEDSFTISAGGNTFANWAAANAGGQGPTLDFDNDGVSNGVEYFFGASGSTFTMNPQPDATGLILFPHPVATPGTTFLVKTSPDLVTWTAVTTTESGGFVRYTLPQGAGKLFVRLEVLVAP